MRRGRSARSMQRPLRKMKVLSWSSPADTGEKRCRASSCSETDAGMSCAVPLLSLAHARPTKPLAPARQHVLVVDIVRDAALERGENRAGCPVDTLAQLAAFRIGGRMRREQHLVAELAQR